MLQISIFTSCRACGQPDEWATFKRSTSRQEMVTDSKGKGKAIPLQAWTGPQGSRRLRFPDFKTIGT